MSHSPVGVVGAAVAVPLLLPPPVPVDQLAEVGRLLTVSDDELVFEQLLRRGTLRDHKTRGFNEEGSLRKLLFSFKKKNKCSFCECF